MKIKINFNTMVLSLAKHHATETGIRDGDGRQLSPQKNRRGGDPS